MLTKQPAAIGWPCSKDSDVDLAQDRWKRAAFGCFYANTISNQMKTLLYFGSHFMKALPMPSPTHHEAWGTDAAASDAVTVGPVVAGTGHPAALAVVAHGTRLVAVEPSPASLAAALPRQRMATDEERDANEMGAGRKNTAQNISCVTLRTGQAWELFRVVDMNSCIIWEVNREPGVK